jgi:hypothetical protein
LHRGWRTWRKPAGQVLAVLRQPGGADQRGVLGAARGGRPKAAAIVARVQALASA